MSNPEREGNLDNPRYIEGLPDDHPLKARENVFAFFMACASQQLLQMLALTLSPLAQPNPGAQLYHFVGGFMEPAAYGECHQECLFPSLTARGDCCGVEVTSRSTPSFPECQSRLRRLRRVLEKLFHRIPIAANSGCLRRALGRRGILSKLS